MDIDAIWTQIQSNLSQLEFMLNLVPPHSEREAQVDRLRELLKQQMLVLYNSDTDQVVKQLKQPDQTPRKKKGRGRTTGTIANDNVTDEQIVEQLCTLINDNYDPGSATITTPTQQVDAKLFFTCVYAYLIYSKTFDRSYTLNAFASDHLKRAFEMSQYPDAYVNYYSPMNKVLRKWDELAGASPMDKSRKLIFEISIDAAEKKQDKILLRMWKDIFAQVRQMLAADENNADIQKNP